MTKSKSARRRARQRRAAANATGALVVRARSRSRSRNRSRTRNTPRVGFADNNNLLPSRSNFQDREAQVGGVVGYTRFSRARARRSRGGRSQVDLHPNLLGYIDPFDEAALGNRYPDEFRGLSGTYTATFESPITTAPSVGTFTDNNQNAVTPDPTQSLIFVSPDPSNTLIAGIVGTQTAAGGQWSGVPNMFAWPNGVLYSGVAGTLNAFGPGTGIVNIDNPVTSINTLRGLFHLIRLVSGGVKVTGTMNFSAVSGTVHACPVAVDTSKMTVVNAGLDPRSPVLTEVTNGWQNTLPQNLNDMVNTPGYVQFPLASLEANELDCIFKRYGQEAKMFKPSKTAWGMDDNHAGQLAQRYGDANSPSGFGHYGICINVTGVLKSDGTPAAPSTPIMDIECRYNLEGQANPATFSFFTATNRVLGSQGLCTHAPPYQPLLDAALDNMADGVPAIRSVDDAGVEEESFIAEVERVWNSAKRVASSVATAVETVGPLLSAMTL